MANILYLVHRMPYPPNKGDKVRSYHLLRHLAKAHRIFLGTFVDDPDDWQHIGHLQAICEEVHAIKLTPKLAKLRSLSGLLTDRSLSVEYYQSRQLQAWVHDLAAAKPISAAVAFSSVMAAFVPPGMPMVLDMVDVDSAKWAAYAPNHAWPLSSLYRREASCLLTHEVNAANRAAATFLVTEAEVELFKRLATNLRRPVEVLGNGVDAEYFSPSSALPNPFAEGECPIVFTGAMDYWPNVDAATWFACEVLPAISQGHGRLRFYIVGRSPTAAVLALAGDKVRVTGTVPDVRPYLQHAQLVVAPLRVARGIQNKILEAMAMAKAVVASKPCVEAIGTSAMSEILAAEGATGFARAIESILSNPDQGIGIGQRARARVLSDFSWGAHLGQIDAVLARVASPGAPHRVGAS